SVTRCPSHVPSQDSGWSVIRSGSSRMEAQGCASLEGLGCGLSSVGKRGRPFNPRHRDTGGTAVIGVLGA
ncbi:MAG: hypothetical protein VW443_06955, partial [Pseudomonadales bacterium]